MKSSKQPFQNIFQKHDQILIAIVEQTESFYKKIVTQLLGDNPELEKNAGRIQVMQYELYVKEVWFDGNLVGWIKESDPISFFGEYKWEMVFEPNNKIN